MKKVSAFLAFICWAIIQPAFAEIIPAPTLVPIEAAIKEADRDTLVIFDVDDVLIVAKDQILQPQYKKFLETLNKDIETRYSEKEAQKLWSIIRITYKNELIDPKMVPLIQETQARGIKVIALTNAMTGPFGEIPSLEDWRIEELESFEYVFKNSWNDIKPKIFSDLKTEDPKRFSLFKAGILFACGVSKGEVLKAFFLYTGLLPKKIIFIDDKKKNLESVETFSNEAKIPFIGFHSIAVAERPKSPLNEKRAKLQFEILEKEHKWLSDEEADQWDQR